MQLAHYMSNPGDYALSKDLDVDLWLMYRKHNNKLELKEVFNFIIVNSSLHDEFDAFKKCEVKLQFSSVEVNELLNLFCLTTCSGLQKCPYDIVLKFGTKYFEMHTSQIDQLVGWVSEMRGRYREEGDCIFVSGAESLLRGTNVCVTQKHPLVPH
jgi:hypothetical protein